MSKIVGLMSGGQSGADRGALDAARECGVPISGWCPAGGWAEDYPEPPGLLVDYPELRETPSRDVIQRTEWVIRDSTCCIVLNTPESGTSPGTDAGYPFCEKHGTPNFTIEIGGNQSIDKQVEAACDWLRSLEDNAIILGFGGPRASEFPGVYDIAYRVVTRLVEELS